MAGRIIKCFYISAFFVFFLLAHAFVCAQADGPARCISGAKVLPLLGGTGDAPIVPVRINGQDEAMYLSFA